MMQLCSILLCDKLLFEYNLGQPGEGKGIHFNRFEFLLGGFPCGTPLSSVKNEWETEGLELVVSLVRACFGVLLCVMGSSALQYTHPWFSLVCACFGGLLYVIACLPFNIHTHGYIFFRFQSFTINDFL